MKKTNPIIVSDITTEEREKIEKALRKMVQNINPVSGCWDTYKNPGSITYRGKQVSAARMTCAIKHGDMESGIVARHLCDCPFCINPDHIVPGTQKDNAQDRISHGRRVPPGSRMPIAPWEMADMPRSDKASMIVTFRLPQYLFDYIHSEADKHGTTLSSIMNDLTQAAADGRLYVKPRSGPQPFPGDEPIFPPPPTSKDKESTC
jgi:hypothetical protein